MLQDLRMGLRMLIKHPSFTVVAVFTLALGMGANITIFSVVNSVLLRSLPYADSDRLVFLWSELTKHSVKERTSAYATISEWRQQNTSFEDLAVFDPASVTLTGAFEAEQASSVRASSNLFPLLGIVPELGRTFTADEEQQQARVVVLSHGLWQRRFAASPDALGQILEIDGNSSQVIGVMPEQFQFPESDTQLWEPITLFPNWEQQKMQRASGPWRVIGRLKPQASLAQAQVEMRTIAERLEQAYPDTNKDLTVNVVPLRLQLTGPNVRLALWILFGAVACVLLMSCTNVANLILARGVAREREIAIRMAMGAGRMRLIRQLLTESVLLSLVAGAAGLVVALAGVKLLVRFGPQNIPNLARAQIDARVLAFSLGISMLTGLLFGLAPAFRISESQPCEALKDGRSATGGIRARRLRGLLVIAEFSLAVLLLSGAGLLVRSFLNLQSVDLGFNPERVLLVNTVASLNSKSDQWPLFYQQAVERVAALPGVEAAGLIKDIVISSNPDVLITVEQSSQEQARTPLNQDLISEDFFKTVRVQLLKGRFFNTQDDKGAVPVAIINEVMARRFWPDEQVIGKRFKFGPPQSTNRWLTVVGVVGDMRRQSLEREPIAQIFLPHLQNSARRMNLLVRTIGDPATLASAIRNEISSIDKTVAVYGVSTLGSRLAQGTAQRRFQTWLLTLFSSLALLLAAVGIYGLIQHSVVVRTREIGTRLALGAQPRDVLRLIIGEGMRLALFGTGAGLLIALLCTQALSGLLFGVTTTDTRTFLAAPLLLLLVGLLACYLPARRAARVDPMLALRHE
ncbi:MAG TPA: ABC transporter permease [Blastocatellia bacterium]|jgi:putative ABC transport system permease protein|nr:ABC transporter permease [Blastocatellia bacterium]